MIRDVLACFGGGVLVAWVLVLLMLSLAYHNHRKAEQREERGEQFANRMENRYCKPHGEGVK